MSRITKIFEKLQDKHERALIGYVTAGDPTPEVTPAIAEALIKGGVDLLELGLPFSDPIADGPVIQAASIRALAAGTTPQKVLDIAKEIRNRTDVPLIIMTYYNPIFKVGLTEFFASAKSSNVDGIIVPDLPMEEAGDYCKAAHTANIDSVLLAAPTTADARLKELADRTEGFLYLVSQLGVTGTQVKSEDLVAKSIKRALQFTKGKVPLAVGFGVSKPEHVKSVIKAGADAVIVGSAFVNIVAANQGNVEKVLAELEATARTLKQATF